MPLISAYGLLVLRRRLLNGSTAYSVNGDYAASAEDTAQGRAISTLATNLDLEHCCSTSSSTSSSSSSPDTTVVTTLSAASAAMERKQKTPVGDLGAGDGSHLQPLTSKPSLQQRVTSASGDDDDDVKDADARGVLSDAYVTSNLWS